LQEPTVSHVKRIVFFLLSKQKDNYPGPAAHQTILVEKPKTIQTRILATNLSKRAMPSPVKIQPKILGLDNEKIELALGKLKIDIENKQRENKQKSELLQSMEGNRILSQCSSRSMGRLNSQPHENENVNGPGAYDPVTSLEFVRNVHSFNITNNILFGEIDKIKSRPVEEEKKMALRFYKSPIFGSSICTHSNIQVGEIQLARQRSRAEKVRETYMSVRKTRHHMTKSMISNVSHASQQDLLPSQSTKNMAEKDTPAKGILKESKESYIEVNINENKA